MVDPIVHDFSGQGKWEQQLKEYQSNVGRPAQLFQFVAARFEKLKDKGIIFPFWESRSRPGRSPRNIPTVELERSTEAAMNESLR